MESSEEYECRFRENLGLCTLDVGWGAKHSVRPERLRMGVAYREFEDLGAFWIECAGMREVEEDKLQGLCLVY